VHVNALHRVPIIHTVTFTRNKTFAIFWSMRGCVEFVLYPNLTHQVVAQILLYIPLKCCFHSLLGLAIINRYFNSFLSKLVTKAYAATTIFFCFPAVEHSATERHVGAVTDCFLGNVVSFPIPMQ